MHPRQRPRARAEASSAEPRQQLGGEGTGGGALARPGGPVEEVGVRRAPAGGQRRAQNGAGMGGAGSVPFRVAASIAPGIVDTLAAVPRGRLITIEGLVGAGKTTLASALAVSCSSTASPRGCCASPAASPSPSASASWSRTPISGSARAPRRCSTRRRAPSSSRRRSSRCSPRASGCSSTASSIRRWPTRAADADSACTTSRRSTSSAPRGCDPIAPCCCAWTRRSGARARRAAARPTASSARTRRSSRWSRAPTTTSRVRSPAGCACSTRAPPRGRARRGALGGLRPASQGRAD